MRQLQKWLGLGLVLLTVAVFWQVRTHDFVNFDDEIFVTENPHVKTGLNFDNLYWAFTTKDVDYWRPLSIISHMVDVQLFGLDAGKHHVTNLLLHVGATLLLYFALLKLTGAMWRSAFVAALFAIHPLHVESVAWLAERKDVLVGFFWMATLWTYAHYAANPSWKRNFLVWVAFAAALMSKPIAVTLPAALLLLDFWPLKRVCFDRSSLLRAVTEKWPMLALSFLLSILTYLVVKSNGVSISSFADLSLGSRLAHAMVFYSIYIGKMFWPSHLAVFYPYLHSYSALQVAGAATLLIGISFFVFRVVHRAPALLVGWLWFLGTLLPVIGILQAGGQAIADRYTYLPHIGLFIMVAWGVPLIVRNRFFLGAVSGGVLCALSVVSWHQTGHWKNSITLFQHALAVTENNYIAHTNLGVAVAERGETDEGIAHYRKALQIYPLHIEAHYNLGVLLAKRGETREAITHFSEALRINPEHAETRYSLGVVRAAQGKFDDAISELTEAVRIDPSHWAAQFNLGATLAQQGRIDEAITHLSEARGLNPDDAAVHSNLGVALASKGRIDEAIAEYRAALRIKPDFAEAHYSLALAYWAKEDRKAVYEQYKALVKISPELAQRLYLKISSTAH